MAAGGNPNNISLGAGRLYVAPIGTAEPADASTALPSAWRAVGYTEDGTTIQTEISNEEIEVAEELDPVLYVTNKRTNMVSVQMAEMSRRNLALALGLGASADNDGTYLEPPDPGDEDRFMLAWDSEDDATSGTNIRWLFRKCLVGGTIETQRNKAPNKALLPIEINVEKPEGLKPFKVFPNSAGRV
jgi:hypothetical protein